MSLAIKKINMRSISIKALLVILLLGFINAHAQTAPISAQIVSHPTISALKVSYKHAPDSTPGVNAIPQALITLADTSISKIYFKLINPQTGSVIYSVNYLLHASTVLNARSLTLYQYNNGTALISNGQAISLRPYLYQVQTESSTHVLSPVYSTIK
jgi:hypothetical protein